MASLAHAGANAPSGTPNRNNTFNNNPYNSPIRRANPNSRQGTESSIPSNRSNLPTNPQTNPRPPTLENGGIGNGNQNRQPALPAPSTNSDSELNR
ncbi:hypothetical protein [Pseudomonas sp.]|uniref:hypothetical protein n=1 Tax=Pseudomonas sp. TaxID=306 RepID=UPI0026178CF4|nr:hypothetical protein [Pseudomonas sp.]